MVLRVQTHIITNHLGDIVAAKIPSANTDDRKPVREPSKNVLDKLYANKGCTSKALTEDLKADGITFIITQRKNMKPKVLTPLDRAKLSKRFITEMIDCVIQLVFDEIN